MTSNHQSQRYIFVCGCPRSGTTALMHLLNSHQSIVVGVERYKFYANRKNIGKIDKSLFTPEVFFDFKDEQTNLNPNHSAWTNRWSSVYQSLEEKFSKAILVGDKYPIYYRFYPEIQENFQDVKWVFMIRNIYDIALSYNSRAANPEDTNWPEKRNYVSAVSDWNESLAKTWHYLKAKKNNLFICQYDRIFSGEDRYLEKLLNFLDVDECSEIKKYYRSITKDWKTRSSRNIKAEDYQAKYISENANFVLAEKLIKM